MCSIKQWVAQPTYAVSSNLTVDGNVKFATGGGEIDNSNRMWDWEVEETRTALIKNVVEIRRRGSLRAAYFYRKT